MIVYSPVAPGFARIFSWLLQDGFMGTASRWKNRAYLAIYFAGALLALTAACGDNSPESAGGPGSSNAPGQQAGAAPAVLSTEQPSSGPAQLSASETTTAGATESKMASPTVATTTAAAPDAAPAMSTATPDPTSLPVLVNTPGPVADLAPDFTLPSIEGPEYTLSQYRGKQPVAVVFYRAYW